jgi:hypothetical protein
MPVTPPIGDELLHRMSTHKAARLDGGQLTPEQAAQRLFQAPRAPVNFKAADETEARRAVEELARLFESAPGVFKDALDGARAGAETLSADRLQGLAEIIQNADDTGASFVEFQIVADYLVAAHDGRAVTLSDVLSMATPWLSNKIDNVLATGRFGIGLMTLRALSDVLDVHSGAYHIRLGEPTISGIESSAKPPLTSEPSATAMCLPLQPAILDTDQLVAWLGRWDDGSLLFLRHVKRVSVLRPDGSAAATLGLTWSEDEPTTWLADGHQLKVERRHAQARDGRTWLVHTTEAPTPKAVRRVRKASGVTVPLGLALPLHPEDHGVIYAGLPVVETKVPFRVNAQFDPVTSRSGLASTGWNNALLPLLADLWVEVVEDLFAEMPAAAWDVVPLPDDDNDEDEATSVVDRLERLLISKGRDELATRAAVRVDRTLMPLSELAVEDVALEGVVEPAEVASLAGLAKMLPDSARDAAGRWRLVLDDWRQASAPLPTPVTVGAALVLLNDANRNAAASIRLTAAGLRAGLAARLTQLACVVTAKGDHVMPPTAGSLHVLLVGSSPLAEQLGVGVRLADDYLADSQPAEAVLAWLRQIGTVIDDSGNEEVVRRLAAAGRAGNCLDEPPTYEQLRALRDAFEQVLPGERSALGLDVGRAIRIAAYTYDSRGHVVPTKARPIDVYLSRAIDREPDSFSVAADRTPGLLWTHNSYAEQLRSSLGRVGGLGPQKFLGLLGAERAPRLVRHPKLQERFVSESRLGLPVGVHGSPPQRDGELRAIAATYTLDDLDSPDLRAAALDISKERKALRRRDRAGALLGALGRAWDRLEEESEVVAAHDFYNWQTKGTTRAFWLWSVGAIGWLDDTDGSPQAPLGLRLKTPGTMAVHGLDATGYLRPEFDAPNRREVLAALGVAGEPNSSDLVDRLQRLRDVRPVQDTISTDAAIVSQALADRLASGNAIAGDLSERELRTAFASGDGLVYTDLGWRTPAQVLVGTAVFRRRYAFVPQVPRAEHLWTALRIRQPSVDDCLRVIGQVSRTRRAPEGDDVLVVLETLRLLGDRLAAAPQLPRQLSRRLANLALFTTRGWTTERPVYEVDDPALVSGLRAEVPVWDPGGEVSQFSALVGPLRITRLGPDATKVIDPDSAQRDDDATDLLASAVSLLQDDLARNDSRTAGALSIGWDRLRDFEVRVDPELRLQVHGLIGRPPVNIEVPTKADVASDVLFMRDSRLLRQVEAGGRAIASLFSPADRRQLAQAWLAACVAAGEGRTAQRLQLAEQQAAAERARTEKDMATRAAALGQEIADRHAGRARRRSANPSGTAMGGADSSGTRPQSSAAPQPKTKPRVLVDPSTLTIANANGQPAAGSGSRGPLRRRGRNSSPLPQPNRDGGSPRGGATAPPFTGLDKESVGLELARLVLGGDAAEIADLRAQHGVGADAVDSLDRFFELKVHLGDEPDAVHLEESQIRRALSTPNFFLVVVSNVEGADARPKVRIIVDPVHQLGMTQSSSVSFTGVRSAEHSLVYELAPILDDEGTTE